MRDVLHIPTGTTAEVAIFTLPSTVTNLQWDTWEKPRGKSMLHAIVIGGGGGGGGGFTRASGAGAGGGGGGGSGVTRITMPLLYLPAQLYVQVGAGGQGQVSGGGTAGSGLLSYLAIYPDTTASNVLALSGAAAAVGGGTGTVATAGAAGTAGTIAVIGSMPLAGMGQFAVIAGQAGIIGAAASNTAGGAQAIPVTSVLCMGGGSGAGTNTTDQAGGTITAIANSFLSQSAPVGAAAGSNDGGSGPMLWAPMFSFCGMGGSSSNAGVGGVGGNGNYGSGGGGGGAGTTGGRGGDGGSGLVILIAW